MNEITKLLKEWKNGDNEALDKLMDLIIPELKKKAHQYMQAERPGHILQTTALVNEAMLRLIPEEISFEDRRQFYGLVARRMRQVLVEYARKESRAKRGGRAIDQLDDDMPEDRSTERPRELLKLEEILTQLAKEDPQRAAIVEYHFFIGLTFTEVADVLGVSKTKVERDWNRTRLQLKRELTGEA